MKWLTFFLFFFLCSGVYAFGVSPSKIDFGEVNVGEEHLKEFILVNEGEEVDLEIESTSYWIESEEEVTLEKDSLDQIQVKLNIPNDAEPGDYEDILMIKRKDNGESFGFGEGVGLKIKYVVLGETNQITGYAIADEDNEEFWIWGGLIVFVVIGLVFWRIYKMKNIYSS